MNLLQLVFGFVNAPLLATFLLGMFWKRSTGHGAFAGLLVGTLVAVIHHGMTLPEGEAVGIKGGWLSVQHEFSKEMARNFWLAIFAFSACLIITIIVSLFTRPREDRELVGLVYSLTERPRDEGGAWYTKPAVLGVIVMLMAIGLNALFW
jgi:SSS family solute:Na+ symporter